MCLHMFIFALHTHSCRTTHTQSCFFAEHFFCTFHLFFSLILSHTPSSFSPHLFSLSWLSLPLSLSLSVPPSPSRSLCFSSLSRLSLPLSLSLSVPPSPSRFLSCHPLSFSLSLLLHLLFCPSLFLYSL